MVVADALDRFFSDVDLGILPSIQDIEYIIGQREPEVDLALSRRAHSVRVHSLGEKIHLRAIIEFSNYCRQDCLYCGLRRSNRSAARYRMTPEEIVSAARQASKLYPFRTYVLQSGEDPAYPPEGLAEAIAAIKAELDAAVTLSTGEHPQEVLRMWRDSGADRFLLKFETSHCDLFALLKPTTTWAKRFGCIQNLKDLGYQVGSGIILGLPGQTDQSLVQDLKLMAEMGLDMASIGPFIPHPETPLGAFRHPDEAELVRKTMRLTAITRLLLPRAHIPATTALGVMGARNPSWQKGWPAKLAEEQGLRLNPDPRSISLVLGANVIMIDVTPPHFRVSYDIYPGKAGADGEVEEVVARALDLISSAGMEISEDRGDSPRFVERISGGAS